MKNVAIYYKLQKNEDIEHSIQKINQLIEKLNPKHRILGVFIEANKENKKFMELINSPLSDLNFLYMNSLPDDEFDYKLLKELARAEQFEIRGFANM